MAKVYTITLFQPFGPKSEKNTYANLNPGEITDRLIKTLENKKCYHNSSETCVNCARMRYIHKMYMNQILKELEYKTNQRPTYESVRIVSISNSTHETKEESHSNKFMVQKYSECKFLCSIPEQRNTKEKEEKFQRELRTSGLGDKDLARRIVTIFDCNT